MPPEIKSIASRLFQEIRRDAPFFSSCGFIVGLFMIWQSRLAKLGVATGDSWPKELFGDFVSFNAFGLVFLGQLALGAIASAFAALNRPLPKLEAVVSHLEERLSQLASSIIAFTAGMSALALLHAFLTLEAGGLLLALSVVSFDSIVFSGFVTAVAVSRRVDPFKGLAPALSSLLVALFVVGWFLVRGAK